MLSHIELKGFYILLFDPTEWVFRKPDQKWTSGSPRTLITQKSPRKTNKQCLGNSVWNAKSM